MNKRDAHRKMWKAVKSFVADVDYESTMDDLSVVLSDDQWDEVCAWIDIARLVLDTPEVKVHGAAPLPLIRQQIERRMV